MGSTRRERQELEFADVEAEVPADRLPTWESQAAQYPPTGPPGISYFRGQVTADYHVDCLLYRDENGELIGILNRYPADFPPYEREGSVNMWVRPDRRRQGIGRSLGLEAMSRWEPHPERLKYTEAGARWVAAMERRYSGSALDFRAEGWEAWRAGPHEVDEPAEQPPPD